MTDTTELATPAAKRRGLTAMRLAELQELASGMGIHGTTGMRKGDLIAAIKARDTSTTASSSAPSASSDSSAPAARSGRGRSGSQTGGSVSDAGAAPTDAAPAGVASSDAPESGSRPTRRSRRASSPATAPEQGRGTTGTNGARHRKRVSRSVDGIDGSRVRAGGLRCDCSFQIAER